MNDHHITKCDMIIDSVGDFPEHTMSVNSCGSLMDYKKWDLKQVLKKTSIVITFCLKPDTVEYNNNK